MQWKVIDIEMWEIYCLIMKMEENVLRYLYTRKQPTKSQHCEIEGAHHPDLQRGWSFCWVHAYRYRSMTGQRRKALHCRWCITSPPLAQTLPKLQHSVRNTTAQTEWESWKKIKKSWVMCQHFLLDEVSKLFCSIIYWVQLLVRGRYKNESCYFFYTKS